MTTTKEDADVPLKETQETTGLNLGDGVYVILEKHDKRLDGHDELLDDHANQLKLHTEYIRELKENSLRLENVVMSESRETRLTITNTNTGLQQLITELMGYKTNESQLAHTLKIKKWESYAKIVGILAGSGGILVYIVQEVLK